MKELKYLLDRITELEKSELDNKSMLDFFDNESVIKDCERNIKNLQSEIRILKSIQLIIAN